MAFRSPLAGHLAKPERVGAGPSPGPATSGRPADVAPFLGSFNRHGRGFGRSWTGAGPSSSSPIPGLGHAPQESPSLLVLGSRAQDDRSSHLDTPPARDLTDSGSSATHGTVHVSGPERVVSAEGSSSTTSARKDSSITSSALRRRHGESRLGGVPQPWKGTGAVGSAAPPPPPTEWGSALLAMEGSADTSCTPFTASRHAPQHAMLPGEVASSGVRVHDCGACQRMHAVACTAACGPSLETGGGGRALTVLDRGGHEPASGLWAERERKRESAQEREREMCPLIVTSHARCASCASSSPCRPVSAQPDWCARTWWMRSPHAAARVKRGVPEPSLAHRPGRVACEPLDADRTGDGHARAWGTAGTARR